MILGTLMILLAWSAFELVERLSNRWWFKYVVVGYAFLLWLPLVYMRN